MRAGGRRPRGARSALAPRLLADEAADGREVLTAYGADPRPLRRPHVLARDAARALHAGVARRLAAHDAARPVRLLPGARPEPRSRARAERRARRGDGVRRAP